MTDTKVSDEALNNFQPVPEEEKTTAPTDISDLMSYTDMRTQIQKRSSVEESLLLTLVGSLQKLELELQHEREERIRLETEIKNRNVTDDEQLAHLTKTVDTLLYNLQGYESSAIQREDDNELERANLAKRRSLEKKKKLKEQMLKKQHNEAAAAAAAAVAATTDLPR